MIPIDLKEYIIIDFVQVSLVQDSKGIFVSFGDVGKQSLIGKILLSQIRFTLPG